MPQAKTLNSQELDRLLADVAAGRNPERDRVIVLLSFKAGLRACEIANLSWYMVTDASGEVADEIVLPDKATKAKSGRTIPMHPMLRSAILSLKTSPPRRYAHGNWPAATDPVAPSERGRYSPNAIAIWFHLRYKKLNLQGSSSHSGRRTFITNAARKITAAGGSLRDVQTLAGHRSLTVTQRYIEADAPAQRRVVHMI